MASGILSCAAAGKFLVMGVKNQVTSSRTLHDSTCYLGQNRFVTKAKGFTLVFVMQAKMILVPGPSDLESNPSL